jgi:putative membrane protein
LADQAEIGDVRLAALALHKSDDPPVVSLATRIRDVDSQLHLELESIANAQHVSFPPATGSHYKRRLHELALESGSRFNVVYLKSQLRADEQILSVYKREVAKGANIYVAAFAKETIPVLDQHIWLARHGIASLAKRARPMRSAKQDVRMQTTDGSPVKRRALQPTVTLPRNFARR